MDGYGDNEDGLCSKGIPWIYETRDQNFKLQEKII
jgi:hypothetical protein